MISNASIADLLRNLGFSSSCVNRAIEELRGRPVPKVEYPPVDRTTYSLTDYQIEDAAFHAACQADSAMCRADAELRRHANIEVRRNDEIDCHADGWPEWVDKWTWSSNE